MDGWILIQIVSAWNSSSAVLLQCVWKWHVYNSKRDTDYCMIYVFHIQWRLVWLLDSMLKISLISSKHTIFFYYKIRSLCFHRQSFPWSKDTSTPANSLFLYDMCKWFERMCGIHQFCHTNQNLEWVRNVIRVMVDFSTGGKNTDLTWNHYALI